MNIPAQHGQTPKQRLEHVARVSRPFHHEVATPNYLIALGLLCMLLALIGLAVVVSRLGSDLIGGYARQVIEWALR